MDANDFLKEQRSESIEIINILKTEKYDNIEDLIDELSKLLFRINGGKINFEILKDFFKISKNINDIIRVDISENIYKCHKKYKKNGELYEFYELLEQMFT